jgi:hypothetical protein
MPNKHKAQTKSKKDKFVFSSDSDGSSVEETKSSKSLKNGNVYKYFTKRNHGSDSSDYSSDDDRKTDLKCYGKSSSSSYSSSSSGSTEFYGKQKKTEKQPQIENKDVQTIVYGFSVLANTKNPKREFLTVTSKDLRIEKCTNESDIEVSPKFIKSASPHSDIVLSLTVRNLKSEYEGMVAIEFPTVNCLNGEKSVSFAPFISKTTQHGDLKNGSTYELIKRDLTEEQQEFLKKYPGHTLETFEDFSNPIGRDGKSFHVNIEPKSCLLEYYDGKQKQLHLKHNERVLVMDSKEHGRCVKQAGNYLEKEFAFSNVTGKDFKMQIRPVMNSTVQKSVDTQIERIKTNSKSTDQEILKNLQAKGFANYYNNHPFTDKDKFDESFAKFKKTNFIFSGEIEIKYHQIKALNQK